MPFIKSLIALKKEGINQKICGAKPHMLDPGLTIVVRMKLTKIMKKLTFGVFGYNALKIMLSFEKKTSEKILCIK